MAPGGRKLLIPAEGWGRVVYEGMLRQRHPNGMAWRVEDLAAACEVSPSTASAWIRKGTEPKGRNLIALAETFKVSVEDMNRAAQGSIYPIYLLYDGRSRRVLADVRLRVRAAVGRAYSEMGVPGHPGDVITVERAASYLKVVADIVEQEISLPGADTPVEADGEVLREAEGAQVLPLRVAEPREGWK